MANGVHPAVKGVEPARLDAVLDGLGSDSGRTQLLSPDHAVLPSREGRDHLIDGKWDAFWSYSPHKPSRLVHAADLRATNATELAPSVPKLKRLRAEAGPTPRPPATSSLHVATCRASR